ncbi:35745_t:CDS:2, partial [Gigaspora margarita]
SQVPLEGFQVPPEGFQVSPEVSIKLHLSPSSFTHPIKLRPSTVKLRLSTSEFHPRAPLNSFASSPHCFPSFTLRIQAPLAGLQAPPDVPPISQVPLEGFQVPPEGFQVLPEVSIKLHLSPSSFTHPIKLCPSTVKLHPSTSEFHSRALLNSFASSSPTASQVLPEGFKLHSQGCKLHLISLQVLPTGFYDLPN